MLFSLFRDHPRMAKETNKRDVESICPRVTKHASRKSAKAKSNMNWLRTIDYGLLWLYIYSHERFSLFDTNCLTDFMISLFLAAPAPRVQRAWTLREKCPYSELFWSVLSRIRTEYEEILRISSYSFQMRENTDQNKPEYGDF